MKLINVLPFLKRKKNLLTSDNINSMLPILTAVLAPMLKLSRMRNFLIMLGAQIVISKILRRRISLF